MMNDMFGINYFAPSGLRIRGVTTCIGLHPMLKDFTPSGQGFIDNSLIGVNILTFLNFIRFHTFLKCFTPSGQGF